MSLVIIQAYINKLKSLSTLRDDKDDKSLIITIENFSIHIDRGPNFQVFLTNMLVTKGASNFKIDKLK